MSKKRVVYVSPESFSDVDFPVVKELKSKYNLTWIVLFNDLNISYKPKSSKTEIEDFCIIKNIDVVILERKGRLLNPKNIIFDYKLLRLINNYKPDLIYIESFIDVYFTLLSYLLLPISKTIVSIHDVIPHKKQLTNLKIFSMNIQRKLFYNFHLFSKGQNEIFKKTYPTKKTFVIPLVPKYIEGENDINVMQKTDITIFLFFGIIRYNKGVDILVKATEILHARGVREFRLIIAGKDDWGGFREFILTNEIYDLQIRMIENNEIPKLLTKAHFLVLPYRDVTQSGPMFFAYNYNIPVIGSNHAGFKEYINDGVNGFIFENENAESLANIMYKAILLNDNEYQKIKHNQKQFVETNLSEKSIIEMYENEFNKIIKSSENTPNK